MTRRLLCFLAISMSSLVVSAPASARQWISIHSADPVVLIDVDSIKGAGESRTFWSKTEYSQERLISGYRRYKSATTLQYVNCVTEQIGVLRVITYDAQGDVIFSNDDNREIPYKLSTIVPESIGEAMLQYVCSRRSDTSTRQNIVTASTISRQQAVGLIQRWLDAKRKIFAPPYSDLLINQLTTGKLRKDLLAESGPVNWLTENNAYYRYEIQKIGSVDRFSAGKNNAVIDLEITESSTLYQAGKAEIETPGNKIYLIRYRLEYVKDTWKIEDYQILRR
jgi:ARC6-like, IMS domain